MADTALFVNAEVVGVTVAVCYLLKLAQQKNLVTPQEVDAALAAAADTAKKWTQDPLDQKAVLQPINLLRSINANGDGNAVIWELPR
jgi:hypothetical protein